MENHLQPFSPNPYQPIDPIDHSLMDLEPQSNLFMVFLSWLVIAAIVTFLFLNVLLQPADSEPREATRSDLVQTNMMVKYMFGAKLTLPGQMDEGQLGEESLNTGLLEQRYCYAILVNEFFGPEAAIEVLQNTDIVADQANYELSERQKELRSALETTFVNYQSGNLDGGLSDGQRQLLPDQLGFSGELALYPDESPDVSERNRIESSASRTFIGVLGGFFGGILVAFAGFVGFVTLLVLLTTGRLRLWFNSPTGRGGIYVETFAVWMMVFFTSSIALSFVDLGEYGLLASVFLFFGSLIALVWPVIRGIPWSTVCRDIGWCSQRNPFAEFLIGIVCYICWLPAMAAAILMVLILMMIAPVPEVVSELAPSGGPSHPIQGELAAGNLMTIILAVVTACVAAPIVEETFFRGVLYRHLREIAPGGVRIVSVLFSAVFNGLIFAAIHPQGWIAIPALGMLAVGFSFSREWRNSLIAPMTMHAVNNGLVTTLLLLML